MFKDYLQLRAIISDVRSSLDDPNEIDIFLANSKYSMFLNRVTRDERKLTSFKHKYTEAQIVETCERYLTQADSPLHM